MFALENSRNITVAKMTLDVGPNYFILCWERLDSSFV